MAISKRLTAQQRANKKQAAIRKIARALRKADWQSRHEPRLLRDKHVTFDGRHGGPLVSGIPRVVDLPLGNYMKEATEQFESGV